MKSYTVITSKETATELNWVIDAKVPLSAEDKEFIKVFAPVVYWSDTNCYHWAFDEKLPSGRCPSCGTPCTGQRNKPVFYSCLACS